MCRTLLLMDVALRGRGAKKQTEREGNLPPKSSCLWEFFKFTPSSCPSEVRHFSDVQLFLLPLPAEPAVFTGTRRGHGVGHGWFWKRRHLNGKTGKLSSHFGVLFQTFQLEGGALTRDLPSSALPSVGIIDQMGE